MLEMSSCTESYGFLPLLYLNYHKAAAAWCLDIRGGSGISDRSMSGMTAMFFPGSRSIFDETTPTKSLAGIQGQSGFGQHEITDCFVLLLRNDDGRQVGGAQQARQ